MFAWPAKLPEAFREAGSMLFSKRCSSRKRASPSRPASASGEYGEAASVRIGLVENEHRIRQAARNVKKFLAQSGQVLSRARDAQPAEAR